MKQLNTERHIFWNRLLEGVFLSLAVSWNKYPKNTKDKDINAPDFNLYNLKSG